MGILVAVTRALGWSYRFGQDGGACLRVVKLAGWL